MAANTTVDSHTKKLQTIIDTNHHIRQSVRSNVNEFLILRAMLLKDSGIQELTGYNEILSPLIEGLRIKQLDVSITTDRVQLAFSGENSSGKTAFLHRFLDIGKILPSGDGPVTARITKLTYSANDQACIRIKRTIQDTTFTEVVDLSPFFTGEKPNWMGVAGILSEHVKRPEGFDEKSPKFAEWARCFVEIHIPSPTLALGIDVYDTPGFFLDDAPVLKEILHDLVEIIHPTIVFMYANPSTDDATRGCFLAMKTALYDLDSTSIFYLNSKADITQMPKFKKGVNVDEFRAILADERSQRYNMLLRAPFLANDKLEGLPDSIGECECFDICSVNSQPIKPYGPLMNDATIQRIIQFVANNDLTVTKHICKLILPIIDAFFNLLRTTSYHTPERLLQLNYDAMNWEKEYFQAYTIHTENYLKDLFSNIFQRFSTEEESIVQLCSTTNTPMNSLERTIQTAVRIEIIKPAIRNTFRKFIRYVLEHIASNSNLTGGAVFNEILIGAIGRQEIGDFAALLLGEQTMRRSVDISILYMMNTISTPIIQCAQNLENLNFSSETELQKLVRNQNNSSQAHASDTIRGHLLSMQTIIEKQRKTFLQAVRMWGDQQKAVIRSLIDIHYKGASPLLDSQQQTVKDLQSYVSQFIRIECKLRAAHDMAKFNGKIPEIHSGNVTSTTFSIFTADWNEEKNLVVKKLSQPVCDQHHSAYYEAHYHLKIAAIQHPNIVNIKYLYQDNPDNEISELWMIFPPILPNLETFLQQPSILISVKRVLKWMINIANALIVIHENGFVHRNIVLSNIVLNEDDCAMLIDLGNWNGDYDLRMYHDPSAILNGMNDDMKGFGEIGQTLQTFVQNDDKLTAVIEEFNDLMSTCAQASQKGPITAEFAEKKLKFILDMF